MIFSELTIFIYLHIETEIENNTIALKEILVNGYKRILLSQTVGLLWIISVTRIFSRSANIYKYIDDNLILLSTLTEK
jgi:hypothetical protein